MESFNYKEIGNVVYYNIDDLMNYYDELKKKYKVLFNSTIKDSSVLPLTLNDKKITIILKDLEYVCNKRKNDKIESYFIKITVNEKIKKFIEGIVKESIQRSKIKSSYKINSFVEEEETYKLFLNLFKECDIRSNEGVDDLNIKDISGKTGVLSLNMNISFKKMDGNTNYINFNTNLVVIKSINNINEIDSNMIKQMY